MKKTTTVLKYALLIILLIIFLGPMVYAIYTSLIPLEYVNKIVPLSEISLDNYVHLFENYPILTWYKNTILVAIITLAGNVTTSLMAGYALAKLEFKGKKVIFNSILATLMIPFQLLITPLYIMVASLGWHNSITGLTVPFLVSSLSIFMARQYYVSIPNELIEAARVDGLGYIRAFFKIILPLSGPLVTTLTIFNFTSTWNAYLVPATFTSDTKQYTLAVGLNTVKDANFIRPNQTMAGVLLLSIPILIVFAFLQKHFIQGIASSGLKE